MLGKRFNAEEIVNKQRQADVDLARQSTVAGSSRTAAPSSSSTSSSRATSATAAAAECTLSRATPR
jgi:hypothetical protein